MGRLIWSIVRAFFEVSGIFSVVLIGVLLGVDINREFGNLEMFLTGAVIFSVFMRILSEYEISKLS